MFSLLWEWWGSIGIDLIDFVFFILWLNCFLEEAFESCFQFLWILYIIQNEFKIQRVGCIALVLISFKLNVCNIKIYKFTSWKRHFLGIPVSSWWVLRATLKFDLQLWYNSLKMCACTHLCFYPDHLRRAIKVWDVLHLIPVIIYFQNMSHMVHSRIQQCYPKKVLIS